MKLNDIAAELKTRARAFPDAVITHTLPHGAQLRLKYLDTTREFRLQVLRAGQMPDAHLEPQRFDAWYREIETFGLAFETPLDARITYQSNATKYAAVIAWSDDVTLADVDEMENADEIAAQNLPLEM